MRRPTHNKYTNLEDMGADRDAVAWYWRLTALLASWMILGGYLILPSAYDQDAHLRFSKGALTIIIVAIMATGYSLTALLCFACPSWIFQAESIFLPALSSSALGLLTVLWSFASSSRYEWNTAAIVSTVLAAFSCLVYGALLVWTNHRIMNVRSHAPRSLSAHSDASYYKNFIANMYPSMRKNADGVPLTEDERINQQMAMLLMKNESGPSPDASSSTFRIDLPEEREHELESHVQGTPWSAHPNSPYDAVGSPLSIVATPHPFNVQSSSSPLSAPPAASPRAPRSISIQEYYQNMRGGSSVAPVPEPLQHLQPSLPSQPRSAGWERSGSGRSRAGSELSISDASMRGRSDGRGSTHSRAVSREERRIEIELGTIQNGALPP